MEKRQCLQQVVLGKLVCSMEKNEIRTLPNIKNFKYILKPKINSKWIKDLNIRLEIIKLLEENTGRTLSDVNHRKILYDPHPRDIDMKINGT